MDAMKGTIQTWQDLRQTIVDQVAGQLAMTAMTAPKSGGKLINEGKPVFLEITYVNDRDTIDRLVEWMRQWGTTHKAQDAYWLRDAESAQRMQGIVFIGLLHAYPPNYDCGACGYATCNEFLAETRELKKKAKEDSTFEFLGPHCTMRAIDLGVAVGSAAKLSGILGADTRCQTRIAAAARKLGIIEADLAVALSISGTHKNIFFDIPAGAGRSVVEL